MYQLVQDFSSRALFIPDRWRSRFHPLKGSRELTIPKRSRLESPGMVYLPILVDFFGFHVGKYTSFMDPMGYLPPSKSFYGVKYDNSKLIYQW